MMPAQDLPGSQTPGQRVFWKEEREDEAIYSVSLKKVRYHSSDKLLPIPDEDEQPISHLQWETMKIRTIKVGSLTKLVEHLAPPIASFDEVDPGYIMAFMTTYRTFSKMTEVVDLLFERYQIFMENASQEKEEVADKVLRGIASVFHVWLEHFPSDFDEPGYTTLLKIQNFVVSEMKASHGEELAKKIQQRLDKFRITPFEDEDIDIITCPLPVSPKFGFQDDMCSIPEENESCLDFLTLPPNECAEQLTMMDAKLFKKVIAWHCLGCVWGKNKKEGRAATVKATVDQFNAVSLRVISTILTCTESKTSGPNMRGKYITRWINVAQECRDLKNFSSLKAILSGLQSASIHRLKKSWSHVSRDVHNLFLELSNIFSEDSNQQSSRELLMKEGTAKWAQPESSPTKKLPNMKKRKSRFTDLGIIQGTVPYLGTFLTDLMMLDAAHQDFTEDGLINFEKRRKEFEVIAQIKLLQEAAKNYIIVQDEKFRRWFDNIKTFTESESYHWSCKVERVELKYTKKKKDTKIRRMLSEPDISKLSLMTPISAQSLSPPPADKQCKSNENSPVMARHKRNNSGSSSSSTSSGVSSGSETSTAPKAPSFSLPRTQFGGLPIGCRSPRLRKARTGVSRRSLPERPSLLQTLPPESPSNRSAHAGCIIRVSIDGLEDTKSGAGVIYRGIWLSDDERTPAVIRSCLEKREMKADPSEYFLVQVLDNGGELVIPDNANVYYALNSNMESLLFKLKKKEHEKPS